MQAMILCRKESGTLKPQLFRQPFADLGRQPLVDAARTRPSCVGNHDWRWSGDGHNQPHHRGKDKAKQRAKFQKPGVPWIIVPDSAKGEKKCKSGDRGNYNQSNVDGAVQTLAAAAMSAGA